MCGLVGIAGHIGPSELKAFNDLLIINQLRGQHSTGVASVSRFRDEVGIIKMVGTPDVLQDLRGYSDVVREGKKVLIGHGRHATTGERTRPNAHPFEFEKVVGAHNGTLPWDSKNKLEGKLSFGTDSEALYHHANEHGMAATIPLIQGAWALTWYDKEYDHICLLRNKERPLTYAFSKERKTLFWASEAWMLHGILMRHGIDFDKVYMLPENVMFAWELPGYGKAFGEVYREEMEGAKFKQSNVQHFPRGRTMGHVADQKKAEDKETGNVATVGETSNSSPTNNSESSLINRSTESGTNQSSSGKPEKSESEQQKPKSTDAAKSPSQGSTGDNKSGGKEVVPFPSVGRGTAGSSAGSPGHSSPSATPSTEAFPVPKLRPSLQRVKDGWKIECGNFSEKYETAEEAGKRRLILEGRWRMSKNLAPVTEVKGAPNWESFRDTVNQKDMYRVNGIVYDNYGDARAAYNRHLTSPNPVRDLVSEVEKAHKDAEEEWIEAWDKQLQASQKAQAKKDLDDEELENQTFGLYRKTGKREFINAWGRPRTKGEFMDIRGSNLKCTYCDGDFEWGDKIKPFGRVEDGQCLCENCATDDEARRYATQ